MAAAESIPPRNEKIIRFIPALLIFVVLAIYSLAVVSEFISWDDPVNVSQNPHLQLGGWDAIIWFWSHSYEQLYIPVTYTLWTVLAGVSRVSTPTGGVEFNPFIFHAANVICHALATVFVYQILRLRVRSAWACAAGALLFAVHPLQVESVAWVTALRDVLSGALALAAAWALLLSVESADQDQPVASLAPDAVGFLQGVHWSLYALSSALLILALLSKPSAVAVIPMVLVLHWIAPRRRWRTIAILLGPWIVLALVDVWITRIAQPVTAPADGGRWWLRPLIAGDSLTFYLYKFLLPIRLGLFYDRTPQAVISQGWIWCTWIVSAAVLGAILVIGRKSKWLVAGASLFIAGVLPVLGLVPFTFQGYSTVADHYVYLAMIGPALALAAAISVARGNGVKVLVVVCTLWLLMLCGLAVAQTRYWHDNVTLYTHAYDVNPQSPEAALLLATQYDNAGDPASALVWLDRAAPTIPKKKSAQSIFHGTKGRTLISAKQYIEAEQELELALELDPSNQTASYNLDVLRERRARGTLER